VRDERPARDERPVRDERPARRDERERGPRPPEGAPRRRDEEPRGPRPRPEPQPSGASSFGSGVLEERSSGERRPAAAPVRPEPARPARPAPAPEPADDSPGFGAGL